MIEINNLTTNQINESFLKNVAEAVLEGESASWRKEKADLSIVLVGQTRIRKLNKKYRGKNQITDVLSFGNGLNEIVICLREVQKNAKRFTPLEIAGSKNKRRKKEPLTGFESTFKQELARVLIHGILHLLGYDHEKSKKEAKKMEEKENYCLKFFKNKF